MNQKRPDLFTIIIILSGVLALVLAVFLIRSLIVSGVISIPALPAIRTATYKASGRPSPNILALTSPVTSITGIVERIDKNQVEIKVPVQLSTPPQTAAELSYVYLNINLSDNTVISKSEAPIPYLLKQTTVVAPAATAATLRISDTKIGDTITISTDSDLRLDKTANATSIFILPRPKSLSGIITKVEGNTITVRGSALGGATPLPAVAMEAKDYLIRVTNDTEISAWPPASATPATSPKPLKLSISDLKEGQTVTVYTDVDVSTITEFDTLLVNPSFPPETPPSVGPATAPIQ